MSWVYTLNYIREYRIYRKKGVLEKRVSREGLGLLKPRL